MRIENGSPYQHMPERDSFKQPEKARPQKAPLAEEGRQPAGEAAGESKNKNAPCPQSIGEQLELLGRQTKQERDKLKILLTCMEIARRISGGDKVPPADHRYLMKHDAGLYARAIMMRFPKNNPHEYKRLSPDDECGDGVSLELAGNPQSCEATKDALQWNEAAIFFDIDA